MGWAGCTYGCMLLGHPCMVEPAGRGPCWVLHNSPKPCCVPCFLHPCRCRAPQGSAAWRGVPSPHQRCAEQLHQQQSGLQGRSAACIAYLHFRDFLGLFISPPCGQADLLGSRQRDGGTDLATGARRGGRGILGPSAAPQSPTAQQGPVPTAPSAPRPCPPPPHRCRRRRATSAPWQRSRTPAASAGPAASSRA